MTSPPKLLLDKRDARGAGALGGLGLIPAPMLTVIFRGVEGEAVLEWWVGFLDVKVVMRLETGRVGIVLLRWDFRDIQAFGD